MNDDWLKGRSYCERLCAWVADQTQFLRMLHAKFTAMTYPAQLRVRSPSIDRGRHGNRDDVPPSAQSLMVGQDFGRDPCSIIGQLDHKGALLVITGV